MGNRGRQETLGVQRIAHALAEVRRVALAAYDAGLCLAPPRTDGSKSPIGSWKQFQERRPSRQEILSWYGPNTGIGLVCGKVSGNVECLEFDDLETYDAYKALARVVGLGDLVVRIEEGYLERSPSKGIHWLYRCQEISGNTRLAQRPEESNRVKVLIETRGEGGYIVIAPSFGKVHPSGRPCVLLRGGVTTIATIAPEERRSLWELARSFDLMLKPIADEGPGQFSPPCGERPGDEFSNQTSWEGVLAPHGWVKVYQRGDVGYWRRPGKESGVSATTNWQGSDLLFVFSTSTVFEPERGYSKFSAHALLEHGGDFKAAAKSLVKQGYGNPRRNPRKGHHRPRPITSWEVRG